MYFLINHLHKPIELRPSGIVLDWSFPRLTHKALECCFKLVISTDDVLQGDSYVFYVVIGIAMGLSAVVPLLLPETGGQPLEDGLRRSSNGAASALAADDEMQLQRLS